MAIAGQQPSTSDVDDVRKAPSSSNDQNLTLTNSVSRLLRLPAELRNKTYEYSLPHPKIGRYLHMNSGRTPPPLIQTCRQTRQETLAMYYSICRFIVGSDEQLIRWVKAIGHEARTLVGKISIYTSDVWIYNPASQKPKLLRRLKHVRRQLKREGIILPVGTITAEVYLWDDSSRYLDEAGVKSLAILRRK